MPSLWGFLGRGIQKMWSMKWIHFIGASYSNTARFLNEARQYGITRRIPAKIAASFCAGDILLLARKNKDRSIIFASAIVTGVMFDENIASKLASVCNASYSPSPLHVDRECGNYDIVSSCEVSLSMQELIKVAEKIQADMDESSPLFVLLCARLQDVYNPPLDTDQKFHRAFSKFDIGGSNEVAGGLNFAGIKNYKKA